LYPRRCEGRTNRIVSLLSRKALDDLHLEVGSVAVAVVESTAVVVERAAPAGVPAR
jgi:molybdopterin-binding protein